MPSFKKQNGGERELVGVQMYQSLKRESGERGMVGKRYESLRQNNTLPVKLMTGEG